MWFNFQLEIQIMMSINWQNRIKIKISSKIKNPKYIHIRSITNKCPLPIVHVVHIVNNCSCSLFMPLTNRYLVVEVSTYIFWKVNLLFLNSTGMKNQVSLEGECYFLTFSRSASLFWMKDHTFFDFFLSSKLVYLLFWLLMALAETPSSKFDVPFRFRFLWNPIKNAVLWLFNNHIILLY